MRKIDYAIGNSNVIIISCNRRNIVFPKRVQNNFYIARQLNGTQRSHIVKGIRNDFKRRRQLNFRNKAIQTAADTFDILNAFIDNDFTERVRNTIQNRVFKRETFNCFQFSVICNLSGDRKYRIVCHCRIRACNNTCLEAFEIQITCGLIYFKFKVWGFPKHGDRRICGNRFREIYFVTLCVNIENIFAIHIEFDDVFICRLAYSRANADKGFIRFITVIERNSSAVTSVKVVRILSYIFRSVSGVDIPTVERKVFTCRVLRVFCCLSRKIFELYIGSGFTVDGNADVNRRKIRIYRKIFFYFGIFGKLCTLVEGRSCIPTTEFIKFLFRIGRHSHLTVHHVYRLRFAFNGKRNRQILASARCKRADTDKKHHKTQNSTDDVLSEFCHFE